MQTIDIAIVLLVLWAAYHGWRQGFIKELTSMIGFFVGLFAAFMLYSSFGNFLAPALSNNAATGSFLGKTIAFIVIWAIVPILLGVVANRITFSLKGLKLGVLNSIIGMILSLAKYLILMSFIFCAMDFVGLLNSEKKASSQFYKPVASIVKNLFEGHKKPQAKVTNATKNNDTVWVNIQH